MLYRLWIIKIILALSLIGCNKPNVKPKNNLSFQERRWEEASIRPEHRLKLDKLVDRYIRTQKRYEIVQKMRKNGVPSYIIFGLHYRESDNSFSDHLHEGSPLTHRTRYVPKGRLPAPNDPPYTWEESAEDAIYVVDKLQGQFNTLDSALNAIEGYNGWGYKKNHPNVPSPYLFSYTEIYQRGKYVADGRFDPLAVDKQAGIIAILKRMKELGVKLSSIYE